MEQKLEFTDRRFGPAGKGFWLYALGPPFFFALFVYLAMLSFDTIVRGAPLSEQGLILGATGLVLILLIIDCVAVLEARHTIQKIELDGNSIRLTPLWGPILERDIESICNIRPTRSFGHIPGISLVDNNRPNINIEFPDCKVTLFGSDAADRFVDQLRS